MEINQLKKDVEALATNEGRLIGSSGHRAARRYLVDRMSALGLEGYRAGSFELPYTWEGLRLVNVIGRLPGSDPNLAPILIAAHYDTCGPFPGADDNAAAMAILLGLLEELRPGPRKRSVLAAFFDAEEPPCYITPGMGSTFFYEHQRVEPIHCAIVMDLVGHDVPIPGLEDLLIIVGMESDPELAQVVLSCRPSPEIRVLPTLNRYVGDLSDHYVFRLNRRPYLFLSCAHWDHYHQPTDTPDKLNYTKIAAIRDYLIQLAHAVCTCSLPGPFEGYDTTETELRFMRKTLGPLIDGLGLKLESRADIDRIAEIMIVQFGL